MMDLNPSTYHINTNLEVGIYDKIKLGLFSEEVPQLFKDEDGVDPYPLTTGVLKMSQEQQVMLDALKSDYECIEDALEYLIAEFTLVKNELEELKNETRRK